MVVVYAISIQAGKVLTHHKESVNETKDNMRTKELIITMLLVILPMVECLADGIHFLVVNAKDGTKTTFAMTDEPKILCKAGELTIHSKSTTFSLSLADVRNYTFSEESTDIIEVMKDGNIKLENGCVVLNGHSAGSVVSAYMQDGRLAKECKADANGAAVVDLSGLPKGIVIMHSNKTDIKIINR